MEKILVSVLMLICLSTVTTHPTLVKDINMNVEKRDNNSVGFDGPPPDVPDEDDLADRTPVGLDGPPPDVPDEEDESEIKTRYIRNIEKRDLKGTIYSDGCFYPGELRYGKQTSGPTVAPMAPGTVLQYECDTGYTMRGEASIECKYHSKLGHYWSFYMPICTKEYDYDQVLRLSNKFYEAQRSGKLPSDNRIDWRGDSALDDGAMAGKDLSGGWYDAGDHVKFNLPMASATTLLGWGFIEFYDAYEAAGEVGHLMANIRWSCEYFIKTLDDDPDITKIRVYYQVGDPLKDHSYWGKAENMAGDNRDVYTCTCGSHCSEIAAESSAALSVCSIAFNMSTPYRDVAFAKTALETSKRLFEFSKHGECRGFYRKDGFYKSRSYWDEIVEASLFLYYATRHGEYLSEASLGYSNTEDVVEHLVSNDNSDVSMPEMNSADFITVAKSEFFLNTGAVQAVAACLSWGDKRPVVHLLLYKFLKEKDILSTAEKDMMKKAQSKIVIYMNTWMHVVASAPGGLRVRDMVNGDWGSNRYAANSAFVALMAAHYSLKMTYNSREYSFYEWRRFAIEQIHYMLGDHGQCYVVGFGDNCCKRPHHRGSSCPKSDTCGMTYLNMNADNPNRLDGALCGGPDINGVYTDNRSDYFHNEVTCDYNAGFQSSIAGTLN
uniref:Endoglucanase n=1 Tax=Saccoglossus kowalevskii TaxID=10224 RepID=A0ABM0MZA7_SACKO|nr:PREDICTED: endoglucanase 16-like [Saccoglossus kowalevskii]